MSLRTERSPPLPARTLPVSAALIKLTTSCSATIASTPTATQKIASNVRCPPRASERVEYDQYIRAFIPGALSGSLTGLRVVRAQTASKEASVPTHSKELYVPLALA